MFANFRSKVTWQGAAVGFVGAIVLAHILYRR